MIHLNKSKGEFYQTYYPPANWDKYFQLTKETSFYYDKLKQINGREFADEVWDKRYFFERDFHQDSFHNIWKKVKHYKPRDPLCLIGEYNQGYN